MIRKQILWAAVTLLMPIVYNAQTGAINSKKVIAAMPAIKKIDSLTAKEQNRIQQEYATKAYPLQQLQQKAESLKELDKQGKLTATQKEELTKTVTAFQEQNKTLQQWGEDAEKNYQEYKATLYQPYLDKISAAIKEVAIAKKLKTVQEVTSLLYVDPSADITEEVIKKVRN